MRKTLRALVAGTLLMVGSAPAWAAHQDMALMGRKLGRGLVNTATGWVAFPKALFGGIQNGDPVFGEPVFGIVAGGVRGVWLTTLRTLGGAYEAVSFPVPIPAGYAPLLNPPVASTSWRAVVPLGYYLFPRRATASSPDTKQVSHALPAGMDEPHRLSQGNHGVLVGGVDTPLRYPPPELHTIRRGLGLGRRGGGLWPFLLTIFVGNRVGLEWNDGRNLRTIEYVRALPYAGWTVIPFYCFETFSEKSMQYVANKERLDRRRQAKYEAHIAQLDAFGQQEEAAYLRRINPFDPENRTPDPLARIPKKELDGFKGNFKAFWVDMLVGHRAAAERIEGRGLRKLEKVYFLVFPKVIEAFEAMAGRGMEEIAKTEGLDEVWLRKRRHATRQQVASTDRKEDN